MYDKIFWINWALFWVMILSDIWIFNDFFEKNFLFPFKMWATATFCFVPVYAVYCIFRFINT